jgi:hypothetical protein
MVEKSLYERLGGVFAIAAVVDRFSDEIVKNPKVGQKSPNPALREWHKPGLEIGRGLRGWTGSSNGTGSDKMVSYENRSWARGKTPRDRKVEEPRRVGSRRRPADFAETQHSGAPVAVHRKVAVRKAHERMAREYNREPGRRRRTP